MSSCALWQEGSLAVSYAPRFPLQGLGTTADLSGWYYYGPRAAAGQGLPKRASLKSFIRSTTLSLGSIAFGSLIVTILELLRLILQAVNQYETGQGDSELAISSRSGLRAQLMHVSRRTDCLMLRKFHTPEQREVIADSARLCAVLAVSPAWSNSSTNVSPLCWLFLLSSR